jgi:lysyl-tRNA synthetase class II
MLILAVYVCVRVCVVVQIQVLADKKRAASDSDWEIHNHIKRGDIIGVTGVAGRSNSGELSVYPVNTQLLTPCLRMLPNKHSGLKDQESVLLALYIHRTVVYKLHTYTCHSFV